MPKSSPESGRRVRYAVVGLGHIAQVAVLPAFAHARDNSELTALVSEDPLKLQKLGKKYGVSHLFSYTQYEQCLNSGEIDAVYIALPNHLHASYAIRAARAGIHVLCEKPLAVTTDECERMIAAAEESDVKLMTAYRLHFEEANLRAIELAQSGKIGDIRLFSSIFSQQVQPGNIRVRSELGGGTLYDMGIYCINAARYIFQDEPISVMAYTASDGEERFRDVEEMASVLLRFPEDRLAMFTCSFNGGDVSNYRVLGTKGDLCLEPAYEYAMGLASYLTVDGKTTVKHYPKRDQFAPELLYFSDCVLRHRAPEPSGAEGLADVRIIEAIYESARKDRAVGLEPLERAQRPTLAQKIVRPGIEKPDVVHAESPSGGK